MAGPLTGIRVLDLGTVVAGPFAATLLADFGAEVIKVEIPGRGDTLRRLGPVNERGNSYWFSADARNKKSITLDLRKDEGKALFLRLVDVSDVVVENFVPGTMARWGLGADVLRERNPRLIVSHASGYGQTGPYADRPGYDRVGVAFGGLWHISGETDGEPMRPGSSLADYLTGTFGALGVLLALYHRDAGGGPGQEVDAALYESVFRAMEHTVVQYSVTGEVRGRVGNSGPAVPTGAFRASDGTWLAIAVAEDAMFRRLMRAIGCDDLADDPAFASPAGRLPARDIIEGEVRQWIGAHTAQEAMDYLVAHEIPIALETTVAEAFTDPQYVAREMTVPVDDPEHGAIRIQGITPKLSATPGAVSAPAPTLGQHNAEIYGRLLGVSDADLAELSAAGVI